jgi:alpha-tubulin suppressor-like RCC1 family protein
MLFVWGENEYGELGQNTIIDYSSPVQVPGSWSRFGSGGRISLVVNTSGELYAAGLNQYGALGQNDTTSRSSPVQVGSDTTWASVVTVGQYQGAFATKTNGTLWAWGRNSQTESKGVLGQNSLVDYSSPVQIPGTTWSTDAKHLATTGNGSVHAIKTDGTYWCWGYASAGQLGQGETNTYYSSPVQIPGTTWSFVGQKGPNGAGGAIKTDGTLWMWGYNAQGELGQNDRTAYSSPRQVPGTTWSTVSTGGYNTVAMKTDGTLWIWGINGAGSLGQNQAYPALKGTSSPVQIPGTTWSNAIATALDTYAIKTDGTLWTWGANERGQLGQNSGPTGGTYHQGASSPVQIPGDWDISKTKMSWYQGGAAISAIT